MADKVARQMTGKIITDKDEIDAKQKGIDLEEGQDFLVDEKNHGVRLTGQGVDKAQSKLGVPSLIEFQSKWEHNIRQAIVAHQLYKKNKEYVINAGKVVIVDEFTGRMMHGRRYSDGLHQAIEAKEVANGERVQVEEETRTYATITFQNYFRMYHKLSGMTGTAVTEAEEFHNIYNLGVVVIPTNKPMLRQDSIDKIYMNEQAKFNQVIKEVEELNKEGRPIIIGTVSVEKSEKLSDMMTRKGVKHEVLNAKLHEKEAYIIAQAGRLGAVTVATNMAGRGVDIVLGGKPDGRDLKEWQKEHDEVVRKGGLHIIGTEHYDERRLDNKLRGMAGCQGEPGSTQFYVSLEDGILRGFGGDSGGNIIKSAGLIEGVPIDDSLIIKTIQSSQAKIDSCNFDLRKHLIAYDNVVNSQGKIIYDERHNILRGADLRIKILSMVDEEMTGIIENTLGKNGDGKFGRIVTEMGKIMTLPKSFNAEVMAEMKPAEIKDRLMQQANALYEKREAELGAQSMRVLERLLIVRVIDNHWIEHLTNMNNVRQGVGLHVDGRRDSLTEYKGRGQELFERMLEGIRHDVVYNIFNIAVTKTPSPKKAA
jgi:preprotein translocase subunit SecA